MPTPITHAFVAVALGRTAAGGRPPLRFWLLLAALGALPDLDTFTFALGIPYQSVWGHRGITHSLLFALVVSFVAAWLTHGTFSAFFKTRWRLWAVLFGIMAAHPLADAMTNGGLGVAFFAPIDNTRYFLPWRPIQVSPIGIRRFLTHRGLRVAISEALCVWLPVSALVINMGAIP